METKLMVNQLRWLEDHNCWGEARYDNNGILVHCYNRGSDIGWVPVSDAQLAEVPDAETCDSLMTD